MKYARNGLLFLLYPFLVSYFTVVMFPSFYIVSIPTSFIPPLYLSCISFSLYVTHHSQSFPFVPTESEYCSYLFVLTRLLTCYCSTYIYNRLVIAYSNMSRFHLYRLRYLYLQYLPSRSRRIFEFLKTLARNAAPRALLGRH